MKVPVTNNAMRIDLTSTASIELVRMGRTSSKIVWEQAATVVDTIIRSGSILEINTPDGAPKIEVKNELEKAFEDSGLILAIAAKDKAISGHIESFDESLNILMQSCDKKETSLKELDDFAHEFSYGTFQREWRARIPQIRIEEIEETIRASNRIPLNDPALFRKWVWLVDAFNRRVVYQNRSCNSIYVKPKFRTFGDVFNDTDTKMEMSLPLGDTLLHWLSTSGKIKSASDVCDILHNLRDEYSIIGQNLEEEHSDAVIVCYLLAKRTGNISFSLADYRDYYERALKINFGLDLSDVLKVLKKALPIETIFDIGGIATGILQKMGMWGLEKAPNKVRWFDKWNLLTMKPNK